MLVIQHNSGLFFHNKGRIILFESEQEATYFMRLFSQYASYMVAQAEAGDPVAMMRVTRILTTECQILPATFNTNTVECGTVLASELLQKVG